MCFCASSDANVSMDDEDEVGRASPLFTHFLVAFFEHQLKVKIRVEWERFSSEQWWITVVR